MICCRDVDTFNFEFARIARRHICYVCDHAVRTRGSLRVGAVHGSAGTAGVPRRPATVGVARVHNGHEDQTQRRDVHRLHRGVKCYNDSERNPIHVCTQGVTIQL